LQQNILYLQFRAKSKNSAMTKLMHEQLTFSTGSPVKIKWCDYDNFKYPLHYHAEYEIIYIITVVR
jgi:hypothetical protein